MDSSQYLLPGEGEFRTTALTEADFYRDLTDFVLRHRQSQGKVAPSTGVTKPLNRDEIKSLRDAMALTEEWFQAYKKKRGGAAFDGYSTHPTASYRQQRYDFLVNAEGFRLRAYDDATGQPYSGGRKKGNITVGIGFNMDAPGAKDLFMTATGLDEEDFKEVYKGKRQLTHEQVRKLFDFSVQQAEQYVHRIFKDDNLTTHQRIALVSLAFNSPSLIGPKLRKAVKSGDHKAALHEILYNSGAITNRNLASRRWREAHMFVGGMDARAKGLPDYKAYINSL